MGRFKQLQRQIQEQLDTQIQEQDWEIIQDWLQEEMETEDGGFFAQPEQILETAAAPVMRDFLEQQSLSDKDRRTARLQRKFLQKQLEQVRRQQEEDAERQREEEAEREQKALRQRQKDYGKLVSKGSCQARQMMRENRHGPHRRTLKRTDAADADRALEACRMQYDTLCIDLMQRLTGLQKTISYYNLELSTGRELFDQSFQLQSQLIKTGHTQEKELFDDAFMERFLERSGGSPERAMEKYFQKLEKNFRTLARKTDALEAGIRHSLEKREQKDFPRRLEKFIRKQHF